VHQHDIVDAVSGVLRGKRIAHKQEDNGAGKEVNADDEFMMFCWIACDGVS
jgi:hypothetical protein